MGSGITAPGSGITTLRIGISGVFHWIKDQAFWINKILRDKGSKFSSRLEPGIKNLGKITGSAMKKYTSLQPCHTRWLPSQSGFVLIEKRQEIRRGRTETLLDPESCRGESSGRQCTEESLVAIKFKPCESVP